MDNKDLEKDESKKVELTDNSKDSKKENRSAQVLKYAIAMLTIVSFFTTSNGLSELMHDSHALIPYLISFGIQIFVLEIGTNLWPMVSKNNSPKRNRHNSKALRYIFNFFVIAAYIFSVCFSSFFSYVFLANSLYSDVQMSDYNIEIENFINSEVKNLKNITEVEGNLIKNTLRSYLPEIQDIYNTIVNISVNKNENLESELNLTKYSISTVSFSFSVENTIASYQNLNSFQISRLNDMRNILDTVELAYPMYYSSYEDIFGRINSNLSSKDVDQLLKEINMNKTNLENLLETINAIEDEGNTGFNNALKQAKDAAVISIEGLINAYDPLINVCQRVKNNTQYSENDINKIRNIFYSVSDINEKDIESTAELLSELLKALQNTANQSTYEEHSLLAISECITYLEEYKKYLDLSNNIKQYEESVLKQVYIISKNQGIKEEENKNAEIQDTANINISTVTEEEWKVIRRTDLGAFISMLKSMPDINTLITLTENTNKNYKKILKEQLNYQEETLKEAYLISRNKLEKISVVETAVLYMRSDFKMMAVFSMLMSVFIDTTPFLVGTYLYFRKKEECKFMNEHSILERTL